jgi:very-short-patch-repair endonuclease
MELMPTAKASGKRMRSSASVSHRARELRHELTPAERRLWSRLRNHQLEGMHIRRQHTLAHFIVDFYYAPSRLVIEIDGDSHADQVEYDARRTEWLTTRGYRVIRFTNEDVLKRLEAVLEQISAACREEPLV